MINLMGSFEAHGGSHPRIEKLESELSDAWLVVADRDAEIKALKFKLEKARDEIEALTIDKWAQDANRNL